MRLRFRFRTIPFLAMLALVTLGVMLGNWQVRRAVEKTALQARLTQRAALPPLVLDGKPVDPVAVEYRRVAVTGEFVADWPLFLDNRPLAGRTGFILLMPFRIAGTGAVVLVERGWLPRDPAVHDRVPHVATPAGRTTIEGVAVLRPARVMELGTAPPLKPGAIVQNVDPAAFAHASGMAVLPVVIEQTSADALAAGELVRDWPAPAIDVDRHKGYAFQWYALAAMAFLFFVMTGFRSGTKQAG
ncbi:SURF1 family protein [Massilia pinisoli]|uniref:SURF1-like protein n=1 Tax=Massilia pinisoli TaxID=1772194 RepID=A0ABT1ZRS8_9BURK|nr:SURF1 family protein [Massilia pinisoli]MCS0582599.1 SURF1 family protein [Massilia pinisoli]